MPVNIKAPKGTVDLLGQDMARFQFLEATARQIFALYGYEEIRTPIFESTDLFVRGIGEVTDIVSKEMYTFQDRSERRLTMRPEGTAGVVRALLERNLLKQVTEPKLYYMGPMFRYERPQKGRQRQFNQIGCEWFGNSDPWSDAETVAMLSQYLEALGFKGVRTRINTIGSREDRPQFIRVLQEYLRDHASDLSEELRDRTETNPLRVLDSKDPNCQAVLDGAPPILDNLNAESQDHFAAACDHLNALGVNFDHTPRLVRGFDYYTHTVFETTLPGLGAQDAVLGGGRYNDLVEDLGGPATPALGASIGVERLAIALDTLKTTPDLETGVDVAICLLDAAGMATAGTLAGKCRAAGLSVRFDYQARSPKASLRDANRAKARCALLLGTDEIAKDEVQVKDLAGGEQSSIPMSSIPDALVGK